MPTRALPLAAWLALLLALPAAALEPVRTDFDPRLDGLPFGNFGDFASPEGNCFGMSLLAIDGYLARQARKQAGIADPPPAPIVTHPQDGHVAGQILASLAQLEAERRDEDQDDPENPRRSLGHVASIRAALERIRAGGTPEVMGLYTSSGDGHATVLYGFDGQALLIYDPNYPGEALRWRWSATTGLDTHPKAADSDLYEDASQVSVTPFAQFHTSKQLGAIRAACAAGAAVCLDRFPAARARVVEQDGQRRVVGRLRPGTEDETYPDWRDAPLRPARAWIVADGRPLAVGKVDGEGRFSVPLPAGLADGAALQVVAVTQDDEGLAGFGVVETGPISPPAAKLPGPGFTGSLR